MIVSAEGFQRLELAAALSLAQTLNMKNRSVEHGLSLRWSTRVCLETRHLNHGTSV
jgi:hypothetical protein